MNHAVSGQVGVAKVLIENGANMHAQDKDGWTPLHSASLNEVKTGKIYKKRNYSI